MYEYSEFQFLLLFRPFRFFHILPVSQHVSILIPRHPWDPVGCGKSFWGIQIPYGLRAHDLHAGGAGNGWHWKPPGHELFRSNTQGWLVCNFYCKQQSAKEVVQVVRSSELQPVKICLNLGYVTVFVHQKPVTCCHLLPSPILRQNLAVRKNLRAWAGGVVASWRRPCRDGADGGRWPRDSTLHSSALSIHQHPSASSIFQYHPVPERFVPVQKRVIYWVICFVYSCLVNLCELYEHPPHDESSVQGDEIGQLKISQSPNTWM